MATSVLYCHRNYPFGKLLEDASKGRRTSEKKEDNISSELSDVFTKTLRISEPQSPQQFDGRSSAVGKTHSEMNILKSFLNPRSQESSTIQGVTSCWAYSQEVPDHLFDKIKPRTTPERSVSSSDSPNSLKLNAVGAANADASSYLSPRTPTSRSSSVISPHSRQGKGLNHGNSSVFECAVNDSFQFKPLRDLLASSENFVTLNVSEKPEQAIHISTPKESTNGYIPRYDQLQHYASRCLEEVRCIVVRSFIPYCNFTVC